MIDLGWLGYIEFSWKFFMAVGSIVLIDLVLAGDNAVVIAMAVKNLKGKQRTLGHRQAYGSLIRSRSIIWIAVSAHR